MSLKVFDLQCDSGHVFEGWFGSLDNYEAQRDRGLLSCPICDSHHIVKKLSAPRINMGRSDQASVPIKGQTQVQGQSQSPAPVAAPGTHEMAQLQAQVMQHIRKIVRNTDNVGDRFAQEARRMHEGEIEERAIRGTATLQEREALAEDGIAVLPIPEYLDDDRLQ